MAGIAITRTDPTAEALRAASSTAPSIPAARRMVDRSVLDQRDLIAELDRLQHRLDGRELEFRRHGVDDVAAQIHREADWLLISVEI